MTQRVKLVSVTQPRIEGISSAEEFLAYVARVSNPTNQNNTATAPRLIKYLLKNKHFSPFEMVHITMEIETTRDIARQILRHRSFSFQEFSQRYAAVSEFAEPREARLQDKKNRQNSIEINLDHIAMDPRTFEPMPLVDAWNNAQNDLMKNAESTYRWAIEHGIAKEVARSVLPEGLTMSRLYMSGSLRSWIHYVDLRAENGTQKEHREIALMAADILDVEFPSIKGAREEMALDEKFNEETRFQTMLLEMAEKNEYGDYVVKVS